MKSTKFWLPAQDKIRLINIPAWSAEEFRNPYSQLWHCYQLMIDLEENESGFKGCNPW